MLENEDQGQTNEKGESRETRKILKTAEDIEEKVFRKRRRRSPELRWLR